MPVFVHLTSHRNLPAIRRGGVAPAKGSPVYVLPVTRNFQISHQWLQELRRFGSGTIVGIYFRIPDDEIVEVGHYASEPVRMPAAEAVALMLQAEQRDAEAARAADGANKAVRQRRRLPTSPEGFQVLIGRRIAPGEILRAKALPQVVGWRYAPGAHGRPPCACLCCERGRYGVGKLLRTVERDEAAGRKPKASLFGRTARSFDRVGRIRAARQQQASTD